CFFFFQAEDGIRYRNVTGVQTCALPISYEQISHPTYLGLRDDRNQLGVVIGASVNAKFPAEPYIVGRWGYNDPGDDGSSAAMMRSEERRVGKEGRAGWSGE